jgi:cyclic-di-GMP-binding protein
MPATTFSPGQTGALDDTLAWLAQPPSADPLRDLSALRRGLGALADADVPPTHKLRIFEVFDPRVRAAHLAVLPLVQDSVLPLSRPLGNVTRAMNQIHALCAEVLLTSATANPAHEAAPQRPVDQSCRNALMQLEQQLVLALMGFGQAPHGLWSRCNAVYRLLKVWPDAECTGTLGRILALATAQPESYTSRELAFLRTILLQVPKLADISNEQPADLDSYFWCDAIHDQAPIASSRQSPTPMPGLLYIDFSPLLATVSGFLGHLETGTPAPRLGLPREANQADYLNVLRRAQSQWMATPKRRFPRRRQNYKVDLCVRLSELWRVLEDPQTSDTALSKWMVINKSPDGCAVEHLSGDISGLIAGSALGMREKSGAVWSICLVRSIRGGAGDRVEIGIEFVAPGAQPVRVVGGAAGEESIPGLLLPAMPQIERREALLITRGRLTQQHFTLIMEKNGKVMLTTCISGRLIQQTSSVEIFEFERTRLPG